MSDKSLGILGIVALVTIVLAVIVGSHQPTISFEFASGQLLIPNLDPAQIRQITVEKGEDKVSMKREGRLFLVDSLRNYPAANREVNGLIRNVLAVRCGSEVAQDASAHADLGVDGGEETETVTFLDGEGTELVKVLVGKSAEGSSGKYVRLASSDTVYRSEEWISLRTGGMDYVDKELLSLQRDDLAKVTVSTEGPTYVIESPDKSTFELKGVPDGKKVKGTEHEGVFGAATYLNFTDFKSESEAKELAFDATYIAETRHKAEYRFEIAKAKAEPKEPNADEGDEAETTTPADKWWVRCRARYLGPKSLEVEGKSDEELAENEKLAESAKAVEEFNEKHQSWVYEISSWKAESMTKKFEDLIEDDDGKPSEVSVSHILIPYTGAERADESVTRAQDEAKAEAERLHGEVMADPESFAELAKDHSSCPSAAEGGDLGVVTADSAFAQAFKDASLELMNVGDVSPVVETEFGYHIIKRTK